MLLNSEIIAEWTIRQEKLGNRFKHLFKGTIQTHLGNHIQRKQLWLANVWVARDRDARKNGNRVRTRNTTAINFMQRTE